MKCQATTLRGTRCKLNAKIGNFCRIHSQELVKCSGKICPPSKICNPLTGRCKSPPTVKAKSPPTVKAKSPTQEISSKSKERQYLDYNNFTKVFLHTLKISRPDINPRDRFYALSSEWEIYNKNGKSQFGFDWNIEIQKYLKPHNNDIEFLKELGIVDKKSWHKWSLKNHPDKSKNNDLFQKVSVIYNRTF